ncbi:MAG: hypothetical protein ACKOX6_18635 [Bdellovibrio sp.]
MKRVSLFFSGALLVFVGAIFIWGLTLPRVYENQIRVYTLMAPPEAMAALRNPLMWPKMLRGYLAEGSVSQIDGNTYFIKENKRIGYKIRIDLTSEFSGDVKVVDNDNFEGSLLQFSVYPKDRILTGVFIIEKIQIPSVWVRIYFRIFRGYDVLSKALQSPQARNADGVI